MGFADFIKNIPPAIHAQTKSYLGEQLAIFEPEEFVLDKPLCLEDYNFVLFYSTPNPAQIDAGHHQFKKGILVIIEPGKEITVFPFAKASPEKYISIMVKKEFLHKILWEATGSAQLKLRSHAHHYSRQLLEIIENFKTEVMNCGDEYPLLLQSIATQLTFQLLRDVGVLPAKTKENTDQDSDYIAKAIGYMQNYYSSNITIEEICCLIYISPHHFKRVFKNQTGQTPYNFLTAIRMEKAKEILIRKELSIEEIARLCGFVNVRHFSTTFKRMEGLTPTEYRKTLIT